MNLTSHLHFIETPYLILWFILLCITFFSFLYDLGKKNKILSIKNIFYLNIFWVVIAIIYIIAIVLLLNKRMGFEFFACFLVEKSLSIDNLFIFYLILKNIQIPEIYQNKVLFWGILGAIILRIIFFILTIVLIKISYKFLYVFGIILIYSGIKIMNSPQTSYQIKDSKRFKLMYKYLPFTTEYNEDKLTLKKNNKTYFTPIFLAIIMVEITDIIFAVDSIPAALAISKDYFIVISSNVLSLLGLKPLYLIIKYIFLKFHLMNYSLAFILIFVGTKLMLPWEIPLLFNLMFIFLSLTGGIIFSILFPKKNKKSYN